MIEEQKLQFENLKDMYRDTQGSQAKLIQKLKDELAAALKLVEEMKLKCTNAKNDISRIRMERVQKALGHKKELTLLNRAARKI